MNVRDTILLGYEGLADGVTLAGERCPACHGGSTGEGSLSVSSREGLLLWKCHRSSCGIAGSSAGSGSTNRYSEAKVPDTRGVVGRTIERGSSPVGTHARELLASKYCITADHIAKWSLGWDDETNRLVIPVTDVRSERLGVVLRSLDGAFPKSKSHTEKDAISWFVNHTARGVIIVEDQFSAIRASDYLTSVALLGTHLNEERVREIRNSGLSPVYLALDNDAFAKAVGYRIKYRGTLNPIVIKLEKDLKDESDQGLSDLFASLSIGV